jgi:hypothetical protein
MHLQGQSNNEMDEKARKTNGMTSLQDTGLKGQEDQSDVEAIDVVLVYWLEGWANADCLQNR